MLGGANGFWLALWNKSWHSDQKCLLSSAANSPSLWLFRLDPNVTCFCNLMVEILPHTPWVWSDAPFGPAPRSHLPGSPRPLQWRKRADLKSSSLSPFFYFGEDQYLCSDCLNGWNKWTGSIPSTETAVHFRTAASKLKAKVGQSVRTLPAALSHIIVFWATAEAIWWGPSDHPWGAALKDNLETTTGPKCGSLTTIRANHWPIL